jgi:hypothetical protein
MALLLAGAFVVGNANQAHASCAIAVLGPGTLGSVASISTSIATAGLAIAYALSRVSDTLTRHANNTTQSSQARNTARANQADARSIQRTTEQLGEIRTEQTMDFQPSQTTCSAASAQMRVGATGTQYATFRTQLQQQNTNFSNNGPGSGAERGTLQATNTVWNNRCTRYADPALMALPAAMAASCPGPADATLRNLDIEPWKALLDPVQFANAARQQAALDAIRMLTEITPPDPVRGNALLRVEGQHLHVLRMRDVTRMNLARAVLEDIAAMRRVDTATGQTHSRLARYKELVTGQRYDTATGQLVNTPADIEDVRLAREGDNAALQLMAARISTQQGMMFEMMRVAEQIVAIDAVDLAMKVERRRVASPSGTSRVMQRQ